MAFDESKVRRHRGRFATVDAIRDDAGQVIIASDDLDLSIHPCDFTDPLYVDDSIWVAENPVTGGMTALRTGDSPPQAEV